MAQPPGGAVEPFGDPSISRTIQNLGGSLLEEELLGSAEHPLQVEFTLQ